MHKGLDPAHLHYAQTWLVVSILAGLAHLTIGYLFGFINDLDHGPVTAYLENGSWALLMIGLWTWIFSHHGRGLKPEFLYTSFGTGSEAAFKLGFTGFPEAVGLFVALPLMVIGLVTMVYGEVLHLGPSGVIVGLLESVNALVNALSYLRMAAVILAKAGMAFVVNLLFFGVYITGHGEDAEWHFATSKLPEVGSTSHGHEVTEIMFGGLLHEGVLGFLVGSIVFIVGHMVVLLLGITSAGLQGVRLEYVEFFNKFYEGGGRDYQPFGGDSGQSQDH